MHTFAVMILAADENIWNRPGVEGAALRPPLLGCRGKAPAGGMGAKPPSAEDKLHSEGHRLP